MKESSLPLWSQSPFRCPPFLWRTVTTGFLLIALWSWVVMEPQNAAHAEERADHRVVLDLTRKETFVTLAAGRAESGVQVEIRDVIRAPSKYRLEPPEGVVRVGKPVDIVFDGTPNMCIRVSLVTRGKDLAVKIAPLASADKAGTVEFTIDRIRRSAGLFQRRVRTYQKQIAQMRKEYHDIETWLAIPGNKPLDVVKSVRARQKLLYRELVAQERALPNLEARYEVVQELAELADRIHLTTMIHLRSKSQ